MSLPGRAARAAAALGLGALFAALLPVTAAHAEDRAVQGGRLDWGIKSSFQAYVTGPVAKGSYTLRSGAATVGAGQFRFHSAKGSYNPDTGALNAGFSGGVRFLGHQKPDGSHELDLTISRPTVRISGGSGTLHADMVSRSQSTGKVTSASQVALARLGLSGIDMTGGTGPITLDNVPATLTSAGAKAFAGYYAAGTPLDPVSLSADVLKGSSGASGSLSGSTSGSSSGSTSGSSSGSGESDGASDGTENENDDDGKKATPAQSGRIEDAAFDWGVRRTFREYVTGSIAQGEWKLSGGAQDGGALFRFPAGAGTYDEKKQRLDARFEGGIRFTGAHGLDLALSNLAVRASSGTAKLYADVASPGFSAQQAALVSFATEGLKAEGGLLTLTEVPAELTAEGAKAFNGMYQAGTAMDPVSLAIALTDEAKLPPLPDLGSDAASSPSAGAAKPTAPTTEPAAASASSTSSPWGGSPALPLGIAAGVLLLAGAAFFVVRMRHTSGSDATEAEGLAPSEPANPPSTEP
ncbi:HtaA domain-containing protein [Streptomyces sp. KLOTTS4A1]|uniref:HtaA domain-containing protein n=1 Tax=Streptomyces sp. KLOTTS4A1 TaxID=3390996 RepID=UPI0039F4CD47